MSNKILIVYSCRERPNITEGNVSHDLSAIEDAQQDVEVNTLKISLTENEGVLSSALLSNDQWVQQVFTSFDLEKLNAMKVVGQEEKDKANLLVRLLHDRFYEHVKSIIKSKEKPIHWSMKLAHQKPGSI